MAREAAAVTDASQETGDIQCVDLKKRFGSRYHVQWEANGITLDEWEPQDQVWLREIRCRHGIVYPIGGDLLGASTGNEQVGKQLRRLRFLVQTRGDIETVVTFHVDHIDTVLALMKPYRRRIRARQQSGRNRKDR